MDNFFFTYYGYLLLALAGVYFSGYFLLWLVKLLPGKPFTALFSCLLTGLTACATITALVATTGNTILCALPILAFLLYLTLKRKTENQFAAITFSEHLKNLALLSIVALAIFGFRYRYGYAVYGQPAIHDDLIYYAKLSGYLLKTGLETSNVEYLYLRENSQLPYHYLEIWLNAAFLTISRATSVHLLYLVTYTVGCVVVWVGFCALFETRVKLTWWLMILLLFCLALTGVDFPDLRGLFFEYSYYLQFNVVFYTKLFPVILFLIGALLLFEYRQEKAAFILLLFLPVISVITAPGVLGGLVCYAVYLFLKDRKKEAFQLLGLCLLTGTFFYLFYSVINAPGSSPYKTHLSDNIRHFISSENLSAAIDIIWRTLLQLLLTFGPFVIAATVFIGPKTLLNSLRSKDFLVCFFICLACLFAWAFLGTMTDSRQFFTNLASPLLDLGLLLAFRLVLQTSRYKLAFVGLVLVNLVINYTEAVKYMNIVPKISPEYQEQVAAALKDMNPIGGYFKTKEEYEMVYTKSSNIFPLGTYLGYYPETQAHHAANLSVFEIPIDPENEALETQLIQNTSFYKFVASQKAAGTFKCLPASQWEFVKHFKIGYLLVSQKAGLPENLLEKVSLKCTDPVSGEKLYLVK